MTLQVPKKFNETLSEDVLKGYHPEDTLVSMCRVLAKIYTALKITAADKKANDEEPYPDKIELFAFDVKNLHYDILVLLSSYERALDCEAASFLNPYWMPKEMCEKTLAFRHTRDFKFIRDSVNTLQFIEQLSEVWSPIYDDREKRKLINYIKRYIRR